MLFRGTVYENVANGLSDRLSELSEEKTRLLVRDACIASNAHEFIEKLPKVSLQTILIHAADMAAGL